MKWAQEEAGGVTTEIMGKPRLDKKKNRMHPPDEDRIRGTLLAEQTA